VTNKKTALAVCAAGALTASLLAGCSSGGTTTPTTDPTTAAAGTTPLVIWVSNDSVITQLIEKFSAEHPEYDVQVTDYGWNDMHDKFIAGLATPEESLPDVMMTPDRTVGEFALLDALQPTSDYKAHLGQSDDMWLPGVWDYFVAPDSSGAEQLYAVPAYWDGRALFYRTDLYEAAGVTAPPTTWEELREVGSKVGDGADVFGVADFSGGLDTQWFQSILYSHGGALNTPDGLTCQLDQPAAVEALAYYKSLYDENVAPKDVAKRAEDPFVAFQQGYYAQAQSGPWWFALIAADPALEGKWAVAPLPEGKTGQIYSHPNPWVLPVGSQNVGGAWAWLDFMQDPENEALWFANAGLLPIKQAAYDLDLAKGDATVQNAIDVLLHSGDAGYNSEHNIANANPIRNDGVAPMLDAVKNGADPQTAAAEACAKINPLLQDR
jgi:multiple sugar transport system substrate-binding protein